MSVPLLHMCPRVSLKNYQHMLSVVHSGGIGLNGLVSEKVGGLSSWPPNRQWYTHPQAKGLRGPKFKDKIWLQTQLQLKALAFIKQINIVTYFENLTVELHVFYVLKTHVIFYANWTLFTIQFIKLIFMYNFRLQKLKIYMFD